MEELLEFWMLHSVLLIELFHYLVYLVYPTIRIKKNTISFNQIADLHKFWIKNEFITSFVFKLGVDRDDDEPERDGGLSVDGFELLLPGLSFPFNPILSRESTWSPFGRGDGDSYSNEKQKIMKYLMEIATLLEYYYFYDWTMLLEKKIQWWWVMKTNFDLKQKAEFINDVFAYDILIEWFQWKNK